MGVMLLLYVLDGVNTVIGGGGDEVALSGLSGTPKTEA